MFLEPRVLQKRQREILLKSPNSMERNRGVPSLPLSGGTPFFHSSGGLRFRQTLIVTQMYFPDKAILADPLFVTSAKRIKSLKIIALK